ncbi:hypothetical protein OS493_030690 [Desmophyllum pertusum]|uniref:Nucleoside diphosphate kinase n=1 Tax=Desmophyllum pertusum TaxID=174260 RepID=A0A9X0CVH7_9CNID|nr:hypothetical protein OS493_030690 [Desmophyllum pertusum]
MADTDKKNDTKERTFLMLKPDAVHRGLIADIIKRFEQKGFKLVSLKFTKVWEGLRVVKTCRDILGETDPAKSKPGSVRGDFSIHIGRNICHGSDSVATAKREIALWFKDDELVDWTPVTHDWIYE